MIVTAYRWGIKPPYPTEPVPPAPGKPITETIAGSNGNTRRCHEDGLRTGNVRQGQSSSKCLRPCRRKRKLQARDPTPCAEKVTLLHELILWRSGGVVAADEGEGSILNALPEPLAVLCLPDWGRAFVKRAAVRDFLSGKCEVVGASLRGDPLALATRLGDHLEAVGV